VGDVAADDDHRAHRRERAPEGGQQHGGEREAALEQQGRDGAQRAGAVSAELLAVLGVQVLHQLAGESDDERRDQHGLRDDHRARREEQAERTERPGPRQQHPDHEPDHDRGEPEEGVRDRHHPAPPGERRDADPGAERETHDGRQQEGGGAHLEREPDDLRELGVPGEEKPERGRECVAEVGHGAGRVTRRPLRAARGCPGR
jgi:hypothetical protein